MTRFTSDPQRAERMAELKFEIEERAAIIEFDGNLPRREAERMAREEVTARWRKEADMQQTKREGKR
jgi:hypothetical protein